MANLDERLASVLSTLEDCRAVLIDSDPETASLMSVLILELQMKLNRISDLELKALCEAMLPDQASQGSHKVPPRRPPLLKLVK